MPLRTLKDEIELVRAIAYVYELAKFIVEKHPEIVSEFHEYYKEKHGK